MAADDKSKRSGAGSLYKSYVVGDYKDLLESLREEDAKAPHGKEKRPFAAKKNLTAAENPLVVEQEESFVETNKPEAAIAHVIETAEPPAAAEEFPDEKEETLTIVENSPGEIEESPAAAEEFPDEIEETPVAAEELPGEIEESPAVAEEFPDEIEETPVLAEELPGEIEETPFVEEELPEEIDEPTAMKNAPPLIASDELAAAIALVIGKDAPPAKIEESPVSAEEPSDGTDETPTEAEENLTKEENPAMAEESPAATEEAPVAKNEPLTAAEETGAAVVLSAAETSLPAAQPPSPQKNIPPAAQDAPRLRNYIPQRKEPALSSEEKTSQGSSFHKDVLFFNLTMVFLLAAIATVLLYSPNMGSFSMFILISCMIFNMIASYSLGLQKGLIVAVIMTFTYGSYILYETMITRTITEINFAYVAWLFFFPLGSLLSGQLSNSVSAYRWALENKKSLEKFVTIDAATGFYNKQGFFRKMDEEFTRAKRYKTDFSILLINIANFNELRIIYGEINSVSILKTVADVVTAQVRYSDIKSLIEENMLGVILTETNEDGAKIVIEKLHMALDRVTIDIDNVKKVIRIKPNIGIATIKEVDRDALEIFERAKDEFNYDRA